jgi:AraC family transcriptional regulator, melibiose operon regulatory protein
MNGKMLVERDPDLRAIDLAAFPVWKREAVSPEEDVRRTLLMSLETRLRRFRPLQASPYSLRSPRPRLLAPKDRNAFQVMYDFITLNFRDQIRVEDIAGAAGLHPNYAISLFKEKCGINIVALVTMLRVYEAQRLILTTERKIIDVAMDTGFSSMSNFYKSFQKLTGRNPSDYRRVVYPTRNERRARL